MGKSSQDDEIKFYKPQKRFIIPLDTFHIPRKLFNEYKKKKYELKINLNFADVVNNCSKSSKKDKETWINQIIKNTYEELFYKGIAKSLECYYENNLNGGLYGLHNGGCFFGESMFSKEKNTSKISLLYLISILIENKFILLDSQLYNSHLVQFGAYEILDENYQLILKKGLNKNCIFPKNFSFQKSTSILQSLIHRS